MSKKFMNSMQQQTALITGITGQDGSYLAESLIDSGYHVCGIIRRSSTPNTTRIDHLRKSHIFSEEKPGHRKGLSLFYGDVTDAGSLREAIIRSRPDIVFNLAAQSHVGISFTMPLYTAQVVAIGSLNVFETVRQAEQTLGKRIRVYQAGSSEMFGKSDGPQSEDTPFRPCSPYAVAKIAAHEHAINYRDAYGMHITNGILFNHESPRRGENFVTRKITRSATRIKVGLQDKLYLGNLDAIRDWGHARDYVEGIRRITALDNADDFVIGTGTSMSVRDFCEYTFNILDLKMNEHVEISEAFIRPKEVDFLRADPSKMLKYTGWKPQIDTLALAREMIEHDLELAKKERLLSDHGYLIPRIL